MNKEILIKRRYRRYNQPETEPTLYQKKVCDKKGIKYFINCYHYTCFNMNSWGFKIQLESKFGTINVTLFNDKEITINQLEIFMEELWITYGSKYYEEFCTYTKDEVKNE